MEKPELNRTWDFTCGSCFHSRLSQNVGAAGTPFICTAHPPTVHVVSAPTPQGLQISTVTAWPEVKKHEGCGEYKKGMDS